MVATIMVLDPWHTECIIGYLKLIPTKIMVTSQPSTVDHVKELEGRPLSVYLRTLLPATLFD